MRGLVSRFRGRPQLITLGLPILALVVTLLLQPGQIHPHYTKNQVVTATLKGTKPNQFPRVEAKLLFRRDLEQAAPDWRTSDDRNSLIWVVAVSGNFGIGPSFGCCSVPSD